MEQILIIQFVFGVVQIHFQQFFQIKILFPAHIIIITHQYIILLKLVNQNVFFSLKNKRKNEFLFQGELYSAINNEPLFGINDPLIQRSFSQRKQLRTQQHDSNWLKSINK